MKHKIINNINYINIFGKIILCLFINSCQAPTAKQKLKLSPENMDGILKRGITTREEVFVLFGEPVRKELAQNQEAWTYEWVDYEQHTVVPGSERGDFGQNFKTFPGYSHYITNKTVITLIFANNGKLINYQHLKQ